MVMVVMMDAEYQQTGIILRNRRHNANSDETDAIEKVILCVVSENKNV